MDPQALKEIKDFPNTFEELRKELNTIFNIITDEKEKDRLRTYFIILFQAILRQDDKLFTDILDTITEILLVPDVRFEKI